MSVHVPDDVLEHFPHAADLVDDLSDTEFEATGGKKLAQPSAVKGRCVVVTGLPALPAAKLPRLQQVLKVVCEPDKAGGKQALALQPWPCGPIVIPVENGVSLGVAFIEFTTAEVAAVARRELPARYKLMEPRQLTTYSFEDFKLLDQPPVFERLADKRRPLRDADKWLRDKKGRDQFAIRYNLSEEASSEFKNKLGVWWWSDPGHGEANFVYGGAREEEAGSNWTAETVMWSPQGRYLATFNKLRGVVLWAGSKFNKFGNFSHAEVTEAVFSRCERYVCTWSPASGGILWDVRTQTSLLTLPHLSDKCDLSFSPDGNYLLQPDPKLGHVYVYDITSIDLSGAAPEAAAAAAAAPVAVRLLGDAPLYMPGFTEASWAPAGRNVFVVFSPEKDANPANVRFVSVPSLETIKTKAFFNVIETSLSWHPDGTFLCLRNVTPSPQLQRKLRSSKKTVTPEDYVGNTTSSLEVFRMDEKDFPVEMIPLKHSCVDLSWEPKGTRLAAVVASSPDPTVYFYDLSLNGTVESSATTMVGRQCNMVAWSPFGRYCVLFAIDYGILVFVDANGSKILAADTHHTANFVEFDPSGRYVVSVKKQPLGSTTAKLQLDNGFNVWSFQGHRLYSEKRDKLYQFLWRPRPVTDAVDAASLARLSREDYAKEKEREKLRSYIRKQRQLSDFERLEKEAEAIWAQTKPGRQALGLVDDEDAGLFVPVTVDVVLAERVEGVTE